MWLFLQPESCRSWRKERDFVIGVEGTGMCPYKYDGNSYPPITPLILLNIGRVQTISKGLNLERWYWIGKATAKFGAIGFERILESELETEATSRISRELTKQENKYMWICLKTELGNRATKLNSENRLLEMPGEEVGNWWIRWDDWPHAG